VGKPYIGFHVSVGKSIDSVFDTAISLGCNTLQMFTRNPRGWRFKELEKEQVQMFNKKRKLSGFKYVIDHMPYLPNLASPDRKIMKKSRDTLLAEVERCEMLKIDYLVVHLGSHMGKGIEVGIKNIAEACNIALEGKGRTKILLENTAGQKNSVGSKFEEISRIIDMIKSKRVGVCLDTCHLFASGYDIRSEEGVVKTMKEFEEFLGIDVLKVVHVNDSKGELGSNLDRHENLGKGNIGLNGFKAFLKYDGIIEKPLILETPYRDMETVKSDLNTLRDLIKE
jgi:deoxyribonuclease-4